MRKERNTKLKVVIIDDFRIIVERLAARLSSIPGVSFVGDADHPEMAWDLIQRTAPDVVIMDIHLRMSQPKNGVAFIAQIKREWPQIKVIVFTNYADTRYRHLCDMNGADVFCDKASDSEALAETLTAMARCTITTESR